MYRGEIATRLYWLNVYLVQGSVIITIHSTISRIGQSIIIGYSQRFLSVIAGYNIIEATYQKLAMLR